jgi:hypothetical protein
MVSRILGFSGVLAILLTGSAVADTYGAPSPSHPTIARDDRKAEFRLPKELKVVWKREEHGRLKAMPKDQRRGWLKRQWASMSDQQKHIKLAELQKKWDSLPESVRHDLMERKRERRQAHRMQREQDGARRGTSSPATGQ